ncbi:ACP S-malonyltransferase [Desulfuromonas acetoxidans]|uniref:Malonyl CoA-acyl carrier protein transacylase n=1 Tax=Desulfuromonas acetoxidans (strain DSM 684 / 11070) TaxID=281689 RepID=Q1K0L2_DESA6|nr:ACP S-malonyltransferase [Desulfuromonas acetoxidans]EAT15929.1 malonyl CoA-acyl carrier protein transacylase [Desulfuromonas acetoxidans DSM 684]
MMLAFIFPGQGAQHAGMGKELSENFSVAREVFEEANDALGFDLAKMCYEGPEEDLKLTANTQPAILTMSVAALRVLQQESDLQADFVAGHSLGEYSALVASGGMTFADAVCTVRQRGTFMQQAVPVGEGAMAAVLGVDGETLEKICAEAAGDQIVSPANFNSPGQIVIAGHTAAVERAIELAKENGAKKAMPLPVSAPFHCALMKPAGEQLAGVLDAVTLSALAIPVVTNVEASANSDMARVKSLLVSQVSAPVRWDESVRYMVEQGVERFIEIGPGKVLCGLIKRIERRMPVANVENLASLKAL